MFRSNAIRTAVSFLSNTTKLSRRLVSGIAVTKETNAKHLQEVALAENCILVDEFDRAIGQSSKRDCHRLDENGHIKLHRAFSVFLFNSNGDMLIQRRSSHKVNQQNRMAFICLKSILSILFVLPYSLFR